MLYKSLFTVALLVLLSACTPSTSISSTSSNGKTIVAIRPTTGSVNLYVACDLKTKEPKVTLSGPIVFDDKTRFIWDQQETHYESDRADDLNSYNTNDSKEILKLLISTNNLKILSTADISKFDIQLIKPSIKAYLERCMQGE
ncbi:hypothetical protein [Acinetobacter baumannii]|uniref:hypothetical protein n=1 Tax=Acinetobacter baumannii TaxID=470 RepID=UPI00233EC093|nr:hypothetical protein [Acinetobacter baumannii]